MNLRFVVTISILVFVVLLAIGVVAIGYVAATEHAIGHFAPFGDAVNVKRK